MNPYGPLLPGGGHGARFDPAPFATPGALSEGLAPCGSQPAGPAVLAMVERVAESYRAMKRDQAGLPSAWLPAGEWAIALRSRTDLYDALSEGRIEPAADILSGFWRNELAPIVKEYATHAALAAGDDEAARRFLHNVVRNWLIWRALTNAPTAALATPPVGNPWGCMIEGTVVAPKASRYHLMARELAGMVGSLSTPVVAEIGGGYGGLAEFFLRDQPHGVWLDYDLPETAVIAAFFHLGSRGGDRVDLYGEGPAPTRRDMLRPGHTYIMPNYAIRDLAPLSVDAAVNMFSLSEVGREPLAAYLERIETITAGWFVHHNMDRPGVVQHGHERIPASTFRLDPRALPLVATGFDPFHGPDGDYRWFIHRRSERP
ncbi:hypothetical protein [Azospirillum largimobile]